MATLGIPQMAGSATKAPYDILGDTMRGTRGLMLDKFRRPEKVKAAMERLVPLAIDWARPLGRRHQATRSCSSPSTRAPTASCPTRTTARSTGRRFKAVLLGLIEQGLVPMVFAEGAYNERLEVIADPEIPARPHDLDVRRHRHGAAKRIVGARQCVGGNVPGALLTMGTPPGSTPTSRTCSADGRRRRLHPAARHRAGRGRPGLRAGLDRGRQEVRRADLRRRHARASPCSGSRR